MGLSLTTEQLQKLTGVSKRCPKAKSSNGHSKAIIAVKEVAQYLAEQYNQSVYGCGEHWHLTTECKVLMTVKPRNLDYAMTCGAHAAKRFDERMVIYGVKLASGKWRYSLVRSSMVHRLRGKTA